MKTQMATYTHMKDYQKVKSFREEFIELLNEHGIYLASNICYNVC